MRYIFLTLSLFFTSNVVAFENIWYWGVSVNNSKTDYFSEQQLSRLHLSQLRRRNPDAFNNHFRITQDDSTLGYSGHVGVRFHENFDWELSFIDFGEYSSTYVGGNFVNANFGQTRLDADYEMSGVNIQLQWRAEVYEKLELVFKAGLLRWEGQVFWTYNDFENPPDTDVINDRGYDESFGIGGLYRLTEYVALRLYWDQFTLDDDRTDTFTLTTQVSFDTVNWLLW